MAVSAQRDAEETRRRLAGWLADRAGDHSVQLTALGGPAFSGFSNETLLYDATWDGGARGLAVRLEPSKHQVFPDTVFEEQVRVLRALAAAGIPVPEILWFEGDRSILGARFFIMGRIDGRAPTDNPPYHIGGWLLEVSPEVRERIWWNGLDAMIAVHALDPKPFEFLPSVPAKEQLARDRAYTEWVLQGRSYPLVEQAHALLDKSVPPDARPALCWGDSRIGNVLYDDDGRVLAVLDWEMCTVGDPIGDLAWFMLLDRHHSDACGAPRLEGFPSYESTVARWQQATGRETKSLDWWMLLGAARYAAILTRVMDLLEETGVWPGAKEMAFENTSTKLLATIMDES